MVPYELVQSITSSVVDMITLVDTKPRVLETGGALLLVLFVCF